MLSDIFDDNFTISKGESSEEEGDWEAYLPTVVNQCYLGDMLALGKAVTSATY